MTIVATGPDGIVRGTAPDAASLGQIPDGWLLEETDAEVIAGMIRTGPDAFENPPLPEAPPALLPDISDRQFAMGLWRDGIVTFAECRAFVKTGDIPAPLQAILDQLPDDDTGGPTARKDADVLLSGATVFRFDHPLVDTIRQAQGWTVAHLRERWAAWAAL